MRAAMLASLDTERRVEHNVKEVQYGIEDNPFVLVLCQLDSFTQLRGKRSTASSAIQFLTPTDRKKSDYVRSPVILPEAPGV